MEILLLDNSSLTPVGEDYCIDDKTGKFAYELQRLANSVTLYGQKVATSNTTHAYKLKENRIRVVALKRKKNKLINYLLLYLRIIPEILRTDFVYIFYPTAYKYIPILCWCLRKPYGLYIRGMQGIDDKISYWNYRRASVVFTVSDHFTSLVNTVSERDVAHTIRPMIPFTHNDVITDRRYRVGQPCRALFLARLDRDKGLAELLQAVKELKEKGYRFELDVVGDGAYMPTVRSMVKELQIEDVVNIRGAEFDPEKIKAYYTQADLYILPTYHEGFPRTLYEAMIFGTPIITTFVGGIPALMVDQFNCKEIIPRSVESIVEQVAFAFDHYEQMILYAKNGTNTVLKIVDPNRLTHAQHLVKMIRNDEKS